MRIHRNQASLLASLSLLLVGLILFLNSGEESENHSAAKQKSERSQSTSSQQIQTTAKSDHAIAREDFVLIEPASKIRRGQHQRLTLDEATKLEWNTGEEGSSAHRLFSTLQDPQWGPLTFDEHTLSAIEVNLKSETLTSLLEAQTGTIIIPLPDKNEVELTFRQQISRGEHTTTLIGQVADNSLTDVLLVFHDGAVSGSVAFHETNTHYQLGMAGNGNIVIRELDPHSFGGCANCNNPEHFAAEIAADSSQEDDEEEGEILSAPAGTDPFDMVVGYSGQARQNSGGTAAMEAQIIAAVDRLNVAFVNSEAGDWFCSLLATIEEPDPDFSDSDFATMGAMLTDLRQTTDGVLDTITDLQQELGADQVSFICNASISGVAGIAGRPGSSQVTARTALNSNALTFCHEVGHNLGLRHAWGDSGTTSTNPTNQENYGWRFRVSSGTRIRTIMAYSSGWSGSRILHFSNPDVIYNGSLTGAVRGFNATDTSSTPDYDQQMVEDGIVGGLGAGFDGSNSQLGARNGHYIRNNTQVMVNRATREDLAVLDPQAGQSYFLGDSSPIFWYGGDHTDTVELALYKGGVFQNTIATGISGEDRWYDWTIPNVPTGNDYTIRATLNGGSFDQSGTFSISKAVESLPYDQGFEGGVGHWKTSPDSDFAWTWKTGGTNTSSAGPDGAFEGNYYFYSEGHDGESFQSSAIEAAFDFSNVIAPKFSFHYHMNGSYLDYLAVDVNDGSGWDEDVWRRDRAQQSESSDPWEEAVIDLSDYAGKEEVTLRFRTAVLLWFAADPAIDNLQIVDSAGPLIAHWSLDDASGSAVNDDSENNFHATQSNATWVSGIVGGALSFNGSDSTVTLPTSAFQSVANEVTISMWAYGDNNQPQADSVLYAVNESGNRVLNVHLPWSDGTVYWDAGLTGTYDRIRKSATPEQYQGQWNHWVFTKNTTSGEMAIYHNGSLWHSEIGHTRTMDGITAVALGSQIGTRTYSGLIDEVQLYNISLDANEISDLYLSYTTTAGVPFAWLIDNGLEPSEAGAAADADGDGQSNGLEWFWGTEPTQFDSPLGIVTTENNTISFDYTRRKIAGVTISAEWSPDLTESSWSPVGLNEAVTADDGEIETFTVTTPMDETKKFIRIRVE